MKTLLGRRSKHRNKQRKKISVETTDDDVDEQHIETTNSRLYAPHPPAGLPPSKQKLNTGKNQINQKEKSFNHNLPAALEVDLDRAPPKPSQRTKNVHAFNNSSGSFDLEFLPRNIPIPSIASPMLNNSGILATLPRSVGSRQSRATKISGPQFQPKPPSKPKKHIQEVEVPVALDSHELFYDDLNMEQDDESYNSFEAIDARKLLDPFSGASDTMRHLGLGRRALFGFFCYRCRHKIADSERKSALETLPPLLKCLNCEKLNSRVLAANFTPSALENCETLDDRHDGWILFAEHNAVMWSKAMTNAEAAALKEAAARLKNLEIAELSHELSELKVDAEALISNYPLERKDELAQYFLTYKQHQDLPLNLGFVLDQRPSGECAWKPIGELLVDVDDFIEYGPEETKLAVAGSEIVKISREPFKDRLKWFLTKTEGLMFEDEYDGPLRVIVNREHLMEAAANWINALHGHDIWRTTRYEFQNEPAMDSGGVAKEWYRLVCDSVFQAQYGLFTKAQSKEVGYEFNPNSGVFQPERHLFFFRFAGRILAKAILEGCFVDSRLSKVIYKHLVKQPMTFHDIKLVDETLYNSLLYTATQTTEEELAELDITFAVSVDHNHFGQSSPEEIELKPGGKHIPVTKASMGEYLRLVTKYYLYDRYKTQVEFFVRGFHEIIPPTLLMIFNADEFEKILCGETTIDVDDWRNNVIYRGVYKGKGEEHPTVQWFWKVVGTKLTEGEKKKLLQFITGSSRVPVGGFKAFQEGKSMLISIESISQQQTVFPRAHTCFNRLELPIYKSEAELENRLRQSLEYVNGFNLE